MVVMATSYSACLSADVTTGLKACSKGPCCCCACCGGKWYGDPLLVGRSAMPDLSSSCLAHFAHICTRKRHARIASAHITDLPAMHQTYSVNIEASPSSARLWNDWIASIIILSALFALTSRPSGVAGRDHTWPKALLPRLTWTSSARNCIVWEVLAGCSGNLYRSCHCCSDLIKETVVHLT